MSIRFEQFPHSVSSFNVRTRVSSTTASSSLSLSFYPHAGTHHIFSSPNPETIPHFLFALFSDAWR